MITALLLYFLGDRKYRETISELSRMTDRELQDIGINRGDIHRIAAGQGQ